MGPRSVLFPDVPAVLGVPPLPRIPPVIYSKISGNLGGASRAIATVALTAAVNPSTPRSSALAAVTGAAGLVSAAGTTLSSYPSALFNSFNDPVGQIEDSLAGITAAINGSPSAPLGDLSSDLNTATDQLGSTTADFNEGAAAVTDDPVLNADGVESVTVTAYRSSVTWGIVKNGKAVIEGDNFVSLEFKQEWVIADYQLEKGAFASYDKVETPFDARVAVSCGGSVAKRTAFLNSIKAIAGDLNLYDINTPEETLSSVNIGHVDYKRTNLNGAGLITVYIYLIQIRETGESSFATAQATPASPSAVKSPAAAATKSGGTVQTTAPTVTQGQKINEALDAIVPGL